MNIDMRHGGNVWEDCRPDAMLDFSVNLRAGGTPEWVLNTIKDAIAYVGYYPDTAMRQARSGLAVYAGTDEARILPTAGGIAAIDLALSMGRGCVYTLVPSFGGYGERAMVHGRKVLPWQGKCAPDETVVICNPNNPTGQAFTRQEILDMHSDIRRQGGTLVVDEAFIDFCPECSVRNAACADLIVVGSLTKTLAMPGVRLGYLCSDANTIEKLERIALPWSLSAAASAVAAAVPEHMAMIAEDRRQNDLSREKMAKSLEAAGFKVFPSRANFLLVDFGRDMTSVVRALYEKHISVRTCGSFGLPDNHLRLAVKTDAENEKLIGTIKALLSSLSEH